MFNSVGTGQVLHLMNVYTYVSDTHQCLKNIGNFDNIDTDIDIFKLYFKGFVLFK